MALRFSASNATRTKLVKLGGRSAVIQRKRAGSYLAHECEYWKSQVNFDKLFDAFKVCSEAWTPGLKKPG